MSYMKEALMSYLDRAINELAARQLPYRSTPWTLDTLTECLLEMADESDELGNEAVNANVVLMTSGGVEMLLERLTNYDGWHGES